MAPAGYSGTPLPKKLGIKEDAAVYVVNPPPDLDDLLGELPAGAIISADSAPRHTPNGIALFFSTSRDELVTRWPEITDTVGHHGAVWVAWPKKTSKVPTDITENTLREDFLPTGWVDVKVCAISDIWSGLKFVLRKELR